MTRQCSSCGGFCGSKKCERENLMSKNHQEIDTSSERVDEIKLPPLPEPLCNLPGHCRDAIAHYTKAAIEADHKHTADLISAYQEKVQALEAENYSLVSDLDDRQARGEPVACRECGGNGAGGDHEDDCKYSEVPSKCSEQPDPVLYAKIQTLRKYQAWRTGEDERTMDEAGIVPGTITSALDAVIKAAENYLKMETK